MKFFDRDREIRRLRDIRNLSTKDAQFTILTGRRRVGKTTMVIKAYDDEPFIYLFVSRKAESELCSDFMDIISNTLKLPLVGTVNRFQDIFELLMKVSQTRPITVMIDEFQDFLRVNKSIFSDMQRIWDLNKDTSKINLLVCGSINSLMNKLFKNSKEPLYGRQTGTMKLRPFMPSTLKEILSEYRPNYTAEDLLSLYLYTGGVAKYVELLVSHNALSAKKMLEEIISQESFFLDEGRNILVEEFGKDYGMYFSILSLIARGHNTRSDMEGILHAEIGGYLSRLQDEYELVTRQQPMFEKSTNKNVHYSIQDNFLRFWFRFIYKYNYMIEIGAYDKLRTIISRDYPTYSGKVLEQYFIESMKDTGEYTRIGSWHDRKGENEIDIIAADELEKKVTFFEVKRQAKDVDLSILRAKAEIFLKTTGQFKDFSVSYKGLSMDDM